MRRVRKERKRKEIRGQGGWREGVRVWRRRKVDKRRGREREEWGGSVFCLDPPLLPPFFIERL